MNAYQKAHGDGERIMVSDMEKMPFNHVSRYKWARNEAANLGAVTAIDGACGTGYGSQILAEHGLKVFAYDRCADVVPYQKSYHHPNVTFEVADLTTLKVPTADCAVSIETIEHLEDDLDWLKRLRASCRYLVATVPNQAVVPFEKDKHKWHFRHYTKSELRQVLRLAGWEPVSWATQYNKWDRSKAFMRPGDDGMTLGVVCQ